MVKANRNPGNFANRSKEEVMRAASHGGKMSSGSFKKGDKRTIDAARRGGMNSRRRSMSM